MSATLEKNDRNTLYLPKLTGILTVVWVWITRVWWLVPTAPVGQCVEAHLCFDAVYPVERAKSWNGTICVSRINPDTVPF